MELIDVDDDDEIVAPQDLSVELILQIDKPHKGPVPRVQERRACASCSHITEWRIGEWRALKVVGLHGDMSRSF